MRLDKYLAEASVGKRKITREYIQAGKVTVNHQVVTEPARDIDEIHDMVEYQGEEIGQSQRVYYMFHKPGGCVTATKDLENKTVLDYFDPKHAKGLFPIGRLDKDTEGLLLLTNHGEFSHSIMHPDKHVEKAYFFWALGELDDQKEELLRTGIIIGENEPPARALQLKVIDSGEYKELKDKMNANSIKEVRINPMYQPVLSGILTIAEGRKHQVKRMLKAVGCYVVYLKRISIGGLMLDETLQPGCYRELSDAEIKMLYR